MANTPTHAIDVPDSPLPSQFFSRDRALTGEQRLAEAIILDVARALQRKLDSVSVAEGRAWIEREGEEPFSFRWCCAALDVDSDMLGPRLLGADFRGAIIRAEPRGQRQAQIGTRSRRRRRRTRIEPPGNKLRSQVLT